SWSWRAWRPIVESPVAQVAENRVEVAVERRVACMCEAYARTTERAALGSARWLGRGDQDGAEEAAFSGMRYALESLPISGRVVIGAPDGFGQLEIGSEIGFGGDPVDLAVDPLEGRGVVARGGQGAMSMSA